MLPTACHPADRPAPPLKEEIPSCAARMMPAVVGPSVCANAASNSAGAAQRTRQKRTASIACCTSSRSGREHENQRDRPHHRARKTSPRCRSPCRQGPAQMRRRPLPDRLPASQPCHTPRRDGTDEMSRHWRDDRPQSVPRPPQGIEPARALPRQKEVEDFGRRTATASPWDLKIVLVFHPRNGGLETCIAT
jgi:hypothetical protein